MGFGPVYDYAAGKQDWMTAGLPTEGTATTRPRAGALARRDVPTALPEERFADVRKRVRAAGWDACVVVNEQRVVLGLLRAGELARESDGIVADVMRPGPSTFRPNVSAEEIAEHMTERSVESSPITTNDGRLVGLLRRADAVRAAEGERAASR